MAPVTRRKQAEMEANSSAAEDPSPAPRSSASKRGQKLALRGKDGDDDKTPSKAVGKKSTVIVFEDEEMSKPAVIKKTVAKPGAPVEEDEESSDDEAPEAVSTTKAASEIKSAAKATQKAAQEYVHTTDCRRQGERGPIANYRHRQATAQKRKRQERDALLKKQADERKKVEENVRSSPASEEGSKSLVAARPPTAVRKRGGQVDVPDLLPAEFLTDSSGESDSEADDATARRSKPKRRKVATVERSLTRLDKGPRDATIGSTVYQVAKKTDGRMAPKVKQYSKNTKELLLKRQRPPAKPRGGFLAKR
ncbi:hypothetical protein LLEC1_04523 [Akanthomyces lecanii]|uniref:Uncharacterized protein n=1 Tax=Cordyceps confragosa TaxID=2714763 RepID=A0A179IBX0_CORDF|nr:hypothetical protein LLEC1_04523 [Akanthomyces lecanii]